MRHLILGLAVAGAVILVLALLLKPFGGSDGAQEAPDAASGGGNLCDRPLPALGSGPLTEEQFSMADAGLEETATLAGRGDVDGAQVAFFTQTHDFTHNVDGPLRDADEGTAKALCRAVVQIEAEFAFGGDASTIAREASRIRELLRQAAADLGFDG